MTDTGEMTFRTAGSVKDFVTVSTGVSRCGHIHDGVSLDNHNEGEWSGGWLIAFEDLERWYLAAKKVRDDRPDIVQEMNDALTASGEQK